MVQSMATPPRGGSPAGTVPLLPSILGDRRRSSEYGSPSIEGELAATGSTFASPATLGGQTGPPYSWDEAHYGSAIKPSYCRRRKPPGTFRSSDTETLAPYTGASTAMSMCSSLEAPISAATSILGTCLSSQTWNATIQHASSEWLRSRYAREGTPLGLRKPRGTRGMGTEQFDASLQTRRPMSTAGRTTTTACRSI